MQSDRLVVSSESEGAKLAMVALPVVLLLLLPGDVAWRNIDMQTEVAMPKTQAAGR